MSNQLNRCWAEIDGAALTSNVKLLRQVGPEIMAVVKADAYGHCAGLIVPLLLSQKIKHFAVATVEEASAIRSLPGMSDVAIYLMAAVLPDDAGEIVRLGLIPFASDTEFVTKLSQASARQGRPAALHIEVDTGIGRAGVAPQQLLDNLKSWKRLPGIVVSGICTHFTAADSDDTADARSQLALFESTLSALPPEMVSGLAIHAANSPAILKVPVGSSTLFRPGLLLYGIAPSEQLEIDFPYRPVLSLRARALLVRHLPAGSDISYSRTYRLKQDANIATIGIGYGDGFARRLSNIGAVILPDGKLAPIRGRVCMDQLCVEVPETSSLRPGDTVTLIGEVGSTKITASEIATAINTTPHEITTCLTARVPRINKTIVKS